MALKTKWHALPPLAQPLWDGSDLMGRTILLRPEYGLGDTLQFIRYAPLVKQRGRHRAAGLSPGISTVSSPAVRASIGWFLPAALCRLLMSMSRC